MKDIANLSQDHLSSLIGSPGKAVGILLPILPGEDGMLPVLLQNLLHQSIQDGLFALKMAVKRRLPNAHGTRDLGNGGGFKSLHREQLKGCFQDLLLCISSLHRYSPFHEPKRLTPIVLL